ncbi:MAG: choice-of-anchor J domain-containing protein [Muribaculaceae bacterium]|nr:choice-of-anchor J domain-containing protein [Muribaculaceae bacterium]
MNHRITALILLLCSAVAGTWAAPTLKRALRSERTARVIPVEQVQQTTAPARIVAPVMAKSTRPAFGAGLHDAIAATAPKSPVMRVLGDGTTIYGSIIYSDQWVGNSAQWGLYTFSASSTPAPQPYELFGSYEANGGGAYYNGKYYWNSYVYTDEMGYTFSTFLTFDMATRQVSKITHSFLSDGFDQTQITHDMTADPTTGTIYAVSYIKVTIDEEGLIERYRPAVSVVDPEMGWATPIAQTPGFIAIACNNAGELYGITKGVESTLYRINKTTGDCTAIGPTGLNPEFVQSATFDPVTDKLYWAETEINGTSGLYEVNVATGAASKIAAFANNEEFTGIFIPEPIVADLAPASAESLEADFVKDALSGKIRFTAPSRTQSGAALSGSLVADVTLDGADFATLDLQPGQAVELTVGPLAEGVHNFGVMLSNAAGEGHRVARSFFVGMDAPEAVSALTLTADANGCPFISWTAPAAGRNDGYIDPSQITYRVVRMPEGLTVADGIKACSFTDRGSFEAQNVSYTVTPFIGAREGLPASTAAELFGSGSELPVTFGLQTKDEFNLGTVIDANRDRDDQYHWGAWYFGADFPAANTQTGAVYGFSPEGPADDWFILPPFTAQAGRQYRVTFDWRNSSDAETVTVTAGSDKTVAAQTITVLPTASYNNRAGGTSTGVFTATASGNCFVGFHITSKRKAGYFYLMSVTVDEVPLAGAPAAVSDFTVTPGAAGALSATLSLKAPALTAEGAALTSLSRVDIFRGNDNTAIHTFANPAPGAALTWTDTEPAHGFNTYRAVAFNSVGQGEKAVAEAFVGFDIPEAVTDFTLAEINGQPVLTWTAPTQGINGGYIDPAALTYVIRRSDGSLMTNKATGTRYVDTSLNPVEKQYFIYYQIQPVSAAGIGDYALSNHIIYGDPYEGPFAESFADGTVSTDPWVMYRVKGNDQLWTLMSQGESPACYPVDDDGGIACFRSTMGRVNDAGRLVSPKLDLSGFDIPVLTFYVYNSPSYDAIYGGEPFLDRLIPELQLPDGSFIELDEPIYVDDPEWTAGWLGYQYDLSAYKGYEFVQLSFHGIADYENDICLDAISVTNEVEYDLAVYSFSVPEAVKAGKDLTLKVTVANNGVNEAKDFKINVLRDGEVYTFMTSSKPVPAKSFASYTLRLPTTIADEGSSHNYSVAIDWNLDKIPGNNRSQSILSKVVSPDIPEVVEFDATRNDGTTMLAWSGLDALRVADGCENYAAFSIDDMGDYTLVDGDGCITFTFASLYYENSGAPMAFMAFNPDVLGVSHILPEWAAHSGSQTFAAFGAANEDGTGAQSNDWLISPEIYGGSTLEFWAKTANPEFGFEAFEVLYSTTNTDVASFRVLEGGDLTAPADWTLFSFRLPDAAKYFAIHYKTNDGFVFYLDDLSYKARVSTEGFRATGYRLYRDGVAIADLDAAARSHTDAAALADGVHTYGLTVLYDNGRESAPALATVRVGTDGIDAAAADAVSVRTEGRDIIVEAPEGADVSIVAASGVSVFAGKSSGAALRCSLAAPGVYLVTVDNKTYKLNL